MNVVGKQQHYGSAMPISLCMRKLLNAAYVRGTSLTQVALAVGVHPGTLRTLVRQARPNPRLETALGVARVLGVDVNYLWRDDVPLRDPPPPWPSMDKVLETQ
jgi:lambda repressor-like predicted transcriptional regulator